MKFLAAYSLFILICVFIYILKDWIDAKTQERKVSTLAGMGILSPIVLFFILLFCGYPV